MFSIFILHKFKRKISKTIDKKKSTSNYKHSFCHNHQQKIIDSILFFIKKTDHQLLVIHKQQLHC